MRVYRDINQLPSFQNTVITIGTFDGVHTGHQQIIKELNREAEAIGGETVIVTFHPHPRKIIQSADENVKILHTINEKIKRLAALGIDHLVIIPFTDDFSQMHPEKYISDFLVKYFHPSLIIIGYDHRFGKNRAGDYILLESMATEFGFMVKEIPEHLINQATVSSSRIRRFLTEGNIEQANFYLGYPYTITGLVIQGDQRGRTIGFPTANIAVEDIDKLIPANGVYAVTALLIETHTSLKGMMNIGIRPTIGDDKKTIEVHLFDFDQSIYGKTLEISIISSVRPEIKFNGLEALKTQLVADKMQIQYLLSSI